MQILVAQRLGGRERLRAVRIEHDLHEALAVAQVDEDDAAVIAAAMDPAGQRDDLSQMAAVDAAAVVGTVQAFLSDAQDAGHAASAWRRFELSRGSSREAVSFGQIRR